MNIKPIIHIYDPLYKKSCNTHASYLFTYDNFSPNKKNFVLYEQYRYPTKRKYPIPKKPIKPIKRKYAIPKIPTKPTKPIKRKYQIPKIPTKPTKPIKRKYQKPTKPIKPKKSITEPYFSLDDEFFIYMPAIHIYKVKSSEWI